MALPWAVSRLVAAIGLAVLGAKPLGSLDLDALVDWDTGWFQSIVQIWYGPADLPVFDKGAWTSWPFFPLHPLLARGVALFGVSDRAALVVVNNVAFLAALWGLYRLARRHLTDRGATAAVWAMALFPGSITSVMGYSGGLFAAGAVWAFVLLEERRYLWSGLAIAVAVSARPNGFLLLAALVPYAFFTVRARGGRWLPAVVATAGPSAVFLVAWAAWCGAVTGDPLVFLNAKKAWEEVTLIQFLKHPLAGNPTVHVFLGVLAVVAVLWQAKRLPWAWHVVVAVMLLPPLVLGVTGLGRYAAETFPVFVALAALLDRLPKWMRPVYFVSSAIGLALFGMMVNRWRYVP